MHRIGSLMAYEFSKTLAFAPREIETPLAKTQTMAIQNSLYLITVLRAGIPFYEGFLDTFDQIDSGFIGAYRSSESESPDIDLDYLASDRLEGREILLVDPMLATGNSLIKSYTNLVAKCGKPAKIHFFSIIGTRTGIANLESHIDIPMSLWIGSVDDELNKKAYIVPGLGDAGDLSFGPKM